MSKKKKKQIFKRLRRWGDFGTLSAKFYRNLALTNAELEEREERDSDNQFGTPFQITITPIVFFTYIYTHTHTYVLNHQ